MPAGARALALALLAGGLAGPAHAQGLVVRWMPLAAPVDAYQVERRVDEGREEFKPIARLGPDATRFADRGVSLGVRYCYRVRGIRGARVSPPSPPLCNVASERAAPAPAREAEAPAPVSAAPAAFGENREVKALHRPPPVYPRSAQLEGISGWVQLAFTVTAEGATRDVRVVAADPPGVFDEAALDAAQRFVYSPRLERGVAVDRANVETEVTFQWINRGGELANGRRPAPR